MVGTIDPEVKFGQINEAPGPERQRNVINETTVITNLRLEGTLSGSGRRRMKPIATAGNLTPEDISRA